jgi:putative tricarboxylic transport membrane protein
MTLTAEKMLDQPFKILNKGAGRGNAMTAYFMEHKGDGHMIGINTNRIIVNKILGPFEYGWDDVTPVARLVAEYSAWAVRSDSKYQSVQEIIADLKKDPKSVVFGVGGLFNSAYFAIVLPAKMAGLDYTKLQVLSVSGESISSLLGGHVPVLVESVGELMQYVEAGKVRLLSITSPDRSERLKGVPTWKELGINYVAPHWRGVFGPPDMPKVAYDYWNKKLAEMVTTKTWKDSLVKYDLSDSFLPGDEFKKELETDAVHFSEVIKSLGVKRKEK